MTRVAILTDNDFDKVNGVTTTLRAVLAHAPADVRPRVYTLSDIGARDDDYLALGAAGIGLPFYPEMRIYRPRFSALTRAIRDDGAALMHLTTPGPVGLIARWASARLGLPMSGSFHTHLAEYVAILSGSAMAGAAMNAGMRWLYGPCDPVLVPSEATRRMLVHAGWRPERLRVWSRGVDTDVFTPGRRSAALRERWRVSDRRPAVLYAGRLSREKGLDDLHAIAAALDRAGASHRLVVVGDGPYRRELAEACPDAVFMGTLPHDAVAVAMASADVFLFPSTTDSLGNVVLEAQAAGLPVVVSNGGGPRENLRDGVSGFVCTGRDPASFAARTGALVRDVDLRRHMSAAARLYALGRRWDQALQPLYQTWRERARRAAVPRHGLMVPAGRRP